MTLVTEIIQQGFRESNIIAVGAQPKPAEAAEGLLRLQNIVTSAYGFEVGEEFSDWPVGIHGINTASVYLQWSQLQWQYPRINSRMIAASTDVQTVYLPAHPYDGSRIALIDPANLLAAAPLTISGNGRQIEDSDEFVANVDGLSKMWFYRADLGRWVSMTPLETIFPFPPEFDDYFITKLAMRLNPRYGRSMSVESLAALEEMLEKLQARYRQSQNVGVDPALNRTSEMYNSRDSRSWLYPPTVVGDRGWIW